MGLFILNPGILTTVQDAGRFGHQAAGFSVSGPMDADALYTANILVNNPPDLACLEMTFLGVTAVFDRKTWFAVTGADMSPTLNGKPIPSYEAHEAKAGDKLVLGPAKNGKYTYLAVAGGIDVPVVMDSRSTNLKCGIGGFSGRKLAAGDDLPLCVTGRFLDNHYKKHLPSQAEIGFDVQISVRNRTKRANFSPKSDRMPRAQSEIGPAADGASRSIFLRVVPGPQAHFFTEQGLREFETEPYTLLPESDRMGARLSGKPVEAKAGVDIISDAIPLGSVQIPASGTPIIMLADRQTTGGYAKIGTVVSSDITKLAQSLPGTEVRFRFVTVEEANRLYQQHQKYLKKLARKTGFCPNKW